MDDCAPDPESIAPGAGSSRFARLRPFSGICETCTDWIVPPDVALLLSSCAPTQVRFDTDRRVTSPTSSFALTVRMSPELGGVDLCPRNKREELPESVEQMVGTVYAMLTEATTPQQVM
jgi:hypothetical protein